MTAVQTKRRINRAEWFGEVPDHWSTANVGSLFRERKDRVSDSEYPPLSVTKAGIVPQVEGVAKTDRNDDRKLVRMGDFAINSRSDRKGSAGVSALDGSVSAITTVLEPLGIESDYAHYLLRSVPFQEEFYRWGHGIVADLWSTKFTEMSRIRVPLPPSAEQHRIANFLDREIGEMDEMSDELDQLVDRLRERRKSAIDVRIAGSSAPMVALHHVTEMLPGYAFPSSGFSPDGIGPRLLRGVNVKPDAIDWSDMVRLSAENGPYGDYELAEGDLVLGMDRPFVGAGCRVSVVDRQSVGSLLVQRVLRIRGSDRAHSRFIQYALLSSAFFDYLSPSFTGISVPHLSEQQVGRFRLALPSASEQQSVVAHLDRETAEIDSMITDAQELQSLIAERRSALITDVVTGRKEIH